MMVRFCSSVVVGSIMVVAWMNFDGGSIVICWLSSSPWSALGGRDRASAVTFVFPGMCWIS
jgi:hypothetical protein